MQTTKPLVLLVAISLLLVIKCNAQVQPVACWSFEKVSDTSVTDVQAQISDTISGNHRTVNGVFGSARVFNEYKSVIARDAGYAPQLQEAFTIDVWLAVAACPWNDVPIISHSEEKLRGYALEMGPRGELRFVVVVNGRIVSARSNDHAVPPHTCARVAAHYAGNDGLSIFVDGNLLATEAMVARENWASVPLNPALPT